MVFGNCREEDSPRQNMKVFYNFTEISGILFTLKTSFMLHLAYFEIILTSKQDHGR